MKTLSAFKSLFFLVISASILTSCVSQKEFSAIKADKEKYEKASKTCNEELAATKNKLATLEADMEKLQRDIAQLSKDTLAKSGSIATMKREYNMMKEMHDAVHQNYSDLMASSGSRNQKMLLQLGEKEQELIDKELALGTLERSLNAKEETINALLADLEARELKVKELEDIIAAKDSAANALKNTILAALKGLNEGDLNVEMKNGKVYVTLSNKLLFTSGSTVVDEAGKAALKKLAEVLKDNKDIFVMVEGHTDTDKGLDNWDLSVKRATSIVRIITDDYGVDPKRMTASGRGEFQPVDSNDTAEGKANNRRTEIILTPNLDEVFSILNN